MTLSKMTLGTVQLGLNYGINNNEGKPSLEKAFKILDTAFLNGITTFDTASGYGDSEKVIGKYFNYNSMAKLNTNIVTKFKIGKVSKNKVEKTIIQSVENSLYNLDVSQVDTLLMHDAKEYEMYKEQIDKTYNKLFNEKIIKNGGASAYTYEEIEKMLENEMYLAFQLPVNMLDQRITNNEAKKKILMNKTIYVRSVYLQGIFFKDITTLKGNLVEVIPYIKKVKDIAIKQQLSIAELALRYVNSLDYVNSLVIGCDNDTQVEQNVILTEKKVFSSDKMREIENQLKGVPDWVFFPMLWDKQV